MIVVLVLLGQVLELRARSKTGSAIRALLNLAPKTARVVQDGAERDVPLESVQAGAKLRVRPGERIPVDGLLLSGMVDKSKRQLGLFRALLIIISTIIMALILYTLTLDKIHDIALLKLIGASNGVIIGLILQQALLMGALGYGLAWWLGQFAFPRFPRLVVIETPDLMMLGGIVLTISVLASLLGIWKAMSVEPNKVLS